MAKFVAIAKAAKTLGLKRASLQQLIRRGDLMTFEGMVDVDELATRFPSMALQHSLMLERTQIIRDNAYARRIQDTVLMSSDALEGQLKRLSVELAVHRAKEEVYRQVIVDLMDKLSQLQQLGTHQQFAEELNSWLLEQFQQGDLSV